MPVAIIVATCGPSWGIGLNNSMPWQHKEDMEFFKARTTGNVVIMGRKTYESMGRPLPNRTNTFNEVAAAIAIVILLGRRIWKTT